MRIERGLAPLPHVEQLVDDENPHAVGQVEQLRRRRIVGHADRVGAHLDEHLELPFGGAQVERRPERAEIVMLVGALDDDALAVDEDAAVRIEAEIADAEACFVAVDHTSALRDRGNGYVQVRLLGGRRAPQRRLV